MINNQERETKNTNRKNSLVGFCTVILCLICLILVLPDKNEKKNNINKQNNHEFSHEYTKAVGTTGTISVGGLGMGTEYNGQTRDAYGNEYVYLEYSADLSKVDLDGSSLVIRDTISSAFTIIRGSVSMTSGGSYSISGNTITATWPASAISKKTYRLEFYIKTNITSSLYSYMDQFDKYSIYFYISNSYNYNGSRPNGASFTYGSLSCTLGSLYTIYDSVTFYDITYVKNGGTILSWYGYGCFYYTRYYRGTNLATYPTPDEVVKDGYTFGGWYTNAMFLGSPVTGVSLWDTGDKTVYAKWIPNVYSVKLVTNGGTINSGNITQYSYGTGATLPTDVTKKGHTFSGWYSNSTFSGSQVKKIGTTEKGDKTFYAKWTPNKYKITLHTNGGTINSGNVTEYTYGVGATLPTDVTKTGHNFMGWYDNSELNGSPITKVTTTDIGNKDYYAKWEPCVYEVILHPNGGVIDEDAKITEYTYGVGAKLPTGSKIKKDACEFAGWYTNSSLTGTPVTNITTTDLGRKEYWAKWITFEIKVDDDLVYVYGADKDDSIMKVDKLEYKLETTSTSRLEAYFTATQDPCTQMYSDEMKTIYPNILTIFKIPNKAGRKVVDEKKDVIIYLQVRATCYDTDGIEYYVYVRDDVRLRYCVAFALK